MSSSQRTGLVNRSHSRSRATFICGCNFLPSQCWLGHVPEETCCELELGCLRSLFVKSNIHMISVDHAPVKWGARRLEPNSPFSSQWCEFKSHIFVANINTFSVGFSICFCREVTVFDLYQIRYRAKFGYESWHRRVLVADFGWLSSTPNFPHIR